jgi:hypothetical protein
MPDSFSFACKRLANDETYRDATERVMAAAVARLLNARTPEEREERWHEHAALKRLREFIAIEAQKADQQ